MTAPTPGPWTNDGGLVYGHDSRPDYAGSPSIDIFDAAVWPAELEAEALANARLIGASLSMLATLRAARSALKSYEYHNASPDLAEEIGRACDAAIALATGVEQTEGRTLLDATAGALALPPAVRLSWRQVTSGVHEAVHAGVHWSVQHERGRRSRWVLLRERQFHARYESLPDAMNAAERAAAAAPSTGDRPHA